MRVNPEHTEFSAVAFVQIGKGDWRTRRSPLNMMIRSGAWASMMFFVARCCFNKTDLCRSPRFFRKWDPVIFFNLYAVTLKK